MLTRIILVIPLDLVCRRDLQVLDIMRCFALAPGEPEDRVDAVPGRAARRLR